MDPNNPKDAEDLTADELARGDWAGQTAHSADRDSLRHEQSGVALIDARHPVAQMFETAELKLRRDALQHAVNVVHNGDAHSVLGAARQFEAYLKGEGSPEQA